MPNLKKLCMNRTGTFSLHPSVGRLKNLENLSLLRNHLSDLPSTLEYCQKLSSLDLSWNDFEHIPGVVLKLKELKELRIAKNSIGLIENAVQTNRSLVPFHSPASLQRLGMAAVIANHIDYWKWENFHHKQNNVSPFDQLASSLNLCHVCGTLVHEGNNTSCVFLAYKCSFILQSCY